MALAAQLQIESDLERLPEVVAWFEQFKQSLLSPERWQQANLALMEGFTNAVRHAHGPKLASAIIKVDARLDDDTFALEIWDHGPPYDFDAALVKLQTVLSAPDFDPLQRESQWGGVIFLRLIQRHGWRIQYVRHGALNCLQAQVNLT
ncbi:MAG: ATP-binding protein [Cyanobacteria bacterium P01_F01_bin.42]